MKNTILICFLIVSNFIFAQENKVTLFHGNNTENKNETFLINNTHQGAILKVQEFISNDFTYKPLLNEGKFSLNIEKNHPLTAIIAKLNSNTAILIMENVEASKENLKRKKSFLIAANEKFIQRLITAKIIEEGLLNELVVYGDKNLKYYENFTEIADILNKSYVITDTLELSIGNPLYDFINKSHKTELDKTLHSSLNLVALNF